MREHLDKDLNRTRKDLVHPYSKNRFKRDNPQERLFVNL